jgi:hypothetical protein
LQLAELRQHLRVQLAVRRRPFAGRLLYVSAVLGCATAEHAAMHLLHGVLPRQARSPGNHW